MNFFLVNYYLVTFGIVTDRQTDRKRRIRTHRALTQVGSTMAEFSEIYHFLPVSFFFLQNSQKIYQPVYEKQQINLEGPYIVHIHVSTQRYSVHGQKAMHETCEISTGGFKDLHRECKVYNGIRCKLGKAVKRHPSFKLVVVPRFQFSNFY